MAIRAFCVYIGKQHLFCMDDNLTNGGLSAWLRRLAKPTHVNGEVAREAGRKGIPFLFAD